MSVVNLNLMRWADPDLVKIQRELQILLNNTYALILKHSGERTTENEYPIVTAVNKLLKQVLIRKGLRDE